MDRKWGGSREEGRGRGREGKEGERKRTDRDIMVEESRKICVESCAN